MKIGSLDLGSRAILAPMAEVTDAPFRQICRENGAGLTFTQMISAKGVVENAFDTLRVLAFNRSEKPIGIQLLGRDADYIEKAVQEIKTLKPDLIDLNCGCSVSNVCKYGLGAAILDDPLLLGKLVKTLVKAAEGIPVSIKIRLGRNRQKINVLENARIIEDNGASFITIHARTRSDSYMDNPLWEWIAKVKQTVAIPVVGNGSLFNEVDCFKMIQETGCDSVFLARGALGNPFIFKRLSTLLETGLLQESESVDEVAKVALHHLDLLIKDSGEDQGVKKSRKHLIWYFRSFNGVHSLIEKIFSLNDRSSLEDFICSHVENIKNDSYPKENFEEINKKFSERVLFWIIDSKLKEEDKQ
ncbi:MAG: tRNA dihydrouridine synthase DusB [Bacteroidota bacterium]|nr:tRNA dihydrouridine synthase DusB [Bacteroidota bacterium]MDP4194115.1 tRNA dihydrouridine synthase DusB [Bacteroidota bacterium]